MKTKIYITVFIPLQSNFICLWYGSVVFRMVLNTAEKTRIVHKARSVKDLLS